MKCILLDRNSKSYRKVIVPIALQSSLVLNSLLALAANQIPSHHDHKRKALQYRWLSLRTLSSRISTIGLADNTDLASASEILGAILMLCLAEVMHGPFQTTNSGNTDMDIHSSGARSILDTPRLLKMNQCNMEMSSFLGQMLSARYALRYTTLAGDADDDVALKNAKYWLSRTTRPRLEINCFAGCSNEMLALLCDIVTCVRQHGRGVLEKPWETRRHLERKVAEITQDQMPTTRDSAEEPQSDGVPAGAASTPEARFLHISEAYKHAVTILLQYLSSPDHPAHHDVIDTSIESILSETYMISALAIPPPGKACRASPLWPAFIAAFHVTRDSSRMKVCWYFEDTMERNPSTCDVLKPMLETIQSVWTHHDLRQAGMCVRDHGDDGTWRFPWEQVLSDKNWMLCWT